MTPADKAAAMVADAAWRFAVDPINAISHASTRAADADLRGDRDQAIWWTSVGVALVALAQPNPHIRVGAVLGDLADKYGVSFA